MKAQLRSSNYVIALTPEQYDKLESMDFLYEVEPRLRAVGAYHIDYNGHFGNNIFFDVKSDTDISVIETELKIMLGD